MPNGRFDEVDIVCNFSNIDTTSSTQKTLVLLNRNLEEVYSTQFDVFKLPNLTMRESQTIIFFAWPEDSYVSARRINLLVDRTGVNLTEVTYNITLKPSWTFQLHFDSANESLAYFELEAPKLIAPFDLMSRNDYSRLNVKETITPSVAMIRDGKVILEQALAPKSAYRNSLAKLVSIDSRIVHEDPLEIHANFILSEHVELVWRPYNIDLNQTQEHHVAVTRPLVVINDTTAHFPIALGLSQGLYTLSLRQFHLDSYYSAGD